VVRVGEGGRAREGGFRVEMMDSRVVSLWLSREGREGWKDERNVSREEKEEKRTELKRERRTSLATSGKGRILLLKV